MSVTATLAQLRAAALDVADMGNSDFRTSAQIDLEINKASERIYREICRLPRAFDLVGKQTAISGTSPYTLPADFYQLQLLVTTPPDIRTHLSRLELELLPYADELAGSNSFALHYIPSFTRFAADGDSFTFVDGWDDYVAASVGARLLQREESDASVALGDADEALQSMRMAAGQKDRTGSARVRDVRFRTNVNRRWRRFETDSKYYRLEGTDTLRVYSLQGGI